MNDPLQRSFDRAQRQYDAQLPPEDDEVDDCEVCECTGKINESNCCGMPMDTDTMMCLKCHEHCVKADCEECKGTGIINLTAQRQEAIEDYMERKAEEARDERLMELRDRSLNPYSQEWSGINELKENE